MNENEHQEYPDMPIDLAQYIENRNKLQRAVDAREKGIDPYAALIHKKKIIYSDEYDLRSDVQWPEKDVVALQDFCRIHGILGYNFGRMSPSAALAFLKNKMGIVDAHLDERVPYGYKTLNKEKKILYG